MLRIHVEEKCKSVTIRVEGKVAGQWVEALHQCCRDVLERWHGSAVIIELDEVLIIDQRGQALLLQLHRRGITLRGRGTHSQYMVERIQGRVAS
jgi:hypothetical protein